MFADKNRIDSKQECQSTHGHLRVLCVTVANTRWQDRASIIHFAQPDLTVGTACRQFNVPELPRDQQLLQQHQLDGLGIFAMRDLSEIGTRREIVRLPIDLIAADTLERIHQARHFLTQQIEHLQNHRTRLLDIVCDGR